MILSHPFSYGNLPQAPSVMQMGDFLSRIKYQATLIGHHYNGPQNPQLPVHGRSGGPWYLLFHSLREISAIDDAAGPSVRLPSIGPARGRLQRPLRPGGDPPVVRGAFCKWLHHLSWPFSVQANRCAAPPRLILITRARHFSYHPARAPERRRS